jgi:2-polyprenyl-6-methoxyphenol hydroxylase-like FAD-dependent oxidoreductase
VDVLLIGGGLAGLAAALDLAQRGHQVTVIERKQYPFHRVCGEYVSNEVLPYLRRLGADPAPLAPAAIDQFLLSSPRGRLLTAPLDLGGFGVSRFALDDFLYHLALARGVTFHVPATVTEVAFDAAADQHLVTLADGRQLRARVVLGTYGKRANLDRQLQRAFFRQRSPYLGVKYHLRLPGFPRNVIALHNFADGYAGISAIEADKLCFCYLTTRQNLKRHGTIPEMERQVLARNPRLREIFGTAEFLYPSPKSSTKFRLRPSSRSKATCSCAATRPASSPRSAAMGWPWPCMAPPWPPPPPTTSSPLKLPALSWKKHMPQPGRPTSGPACGWAARCRACLAARC